MGEEANNESTELERLIDTVLNELTIEDVRRLVRHIEGELSRRAIRLVDSNC